MIRCDQKVVIITGANAGIGKECAVQLAQRGAKVYMACRNSTKSDEALKEVISRSGSQNVLLRHLDLSSLESVRAFAEKFLQEESRLDILINNAGVFCCPQSKTVDGFETQMGTNHLGHFLLTSLLLDILKKSAPARIVVVSSSAQLRGTIHKDDLMIEKSYSPLKGYSNSKLANVIFTKELSRRLAGTGVTVNALHPGVVKTEGHRHIANSYGRVANWMLGVVTRLFFSSVADGTKTILFVALDPTLQDVSGEYFDNCKKSAVNAQANDEDLAKWLWDESMKLTKLLDAGSQ